MQNRVFFRLPPLLIISTYPRLPTGFVFGLALAKIAFAAAICSSNSRFSSAHFASSSSTVVAEASCLGAFFGAFFALAEVISLGSADLTSEVAGFTSTVDFDFSIRAYAASA